MFFSESEYKVNPVLEGSAMKANIMNNKSLVSEVTFDYKDITLSSPITFMISTITLIIMLFIFMNKEWLSMGTILVQILFNN